MTQPRLLLLDEPLASVDQPLRERILLYLRRIRDLGVPMIYVTHQPFEALALSSECVVLRDGAIAAEGAVARCSPIRMWRASRQRLRGVEPAVTIRPRNHARHDDRGLDARAAVRSVAEARFPLVVRISAEEIVVFGERPRRSRRGTSSRDGDVAAQREGVVDLIVPTPAPLPVASRAPRPRPWSRDGSRVWLALRSRAFRIVG